MRPTRFFYFLTSLVGLLMVTKVGCISINAGGCDSAKFKATRTLAAPAASALVVQGRNGGISLQRGAPDLSQTAITAHLAATTQERLDAARVVADVQPDGSLLVSVEWPGGRALNNESASFEIAVPAATGAVTATTSNGPIRLTHLSGPAKLRTSNGRVTVEDHAGPVDARTSNGGVTLARVAGDAEVHTSNGAIDMKDVTGRATAHTSNGGVTLALAPTSPGPVDVRTSNGSAKVTLPPTYAGRVSLSTSNGSVNYPTAPPVHDISAGKHHANFAVNDGPGNSTVSTSNGSIDVRLAQQE